MQVALGDARKLAALADSGRDPLLQLGLVDRIAGSLAPINILLRLADNEAGRTARSHTTAAQQLREQLAGNDLNGLIESLAAMALRYPLIIPPYRTTDASIRSGRDTHRQHCAVCHDHPASGVARPAYRLQQQAAQLSNTEFFARMLVGVRGDRLSGIDNPLSDFQIAALIQFYRSGQ